METKINDVTGDLLSGLGLEQVDTRVSRQRGRFLVRISVDKEGGVTIDDCSVASELIGQVLDREEIIDGAYVLEVMSPGLYRPLKKRRDFEQSVGKRVKVRLKQPHSGNRSYCGILTDAGDAGVTIDLGREQVELKYESVAGARLEPELPW
jgi:ribosome maturation factor RimP